MVNVSGALPRFRRRRRPGTQRPDHVRSSFRVRSARGARPLSRSVLRFFAAALCPAHQNCRYRHLWQRPTNSRVGRRRSGQPRSFQSSAVEARQSAFFLHWALWTQRSCGYVNTMVCDWLMCNSRHLRRDWQGRVLGQHYRDRCSIRWRCRTRRDRCRRDWH